MTSGFWQGKRVLVTGHTGFKGSWLSIWLQQLGADVTGYSLAPPTDPNLFELAKVADGIKDIRGDIRDLELLKKSLRKSKAEIIIHMAAQPLVRDSYKFPLETYSTNVMGTVSLFEAVRSNKNVKAVINVTTDKCYENREWVWGYRESEPLGGYDPYSSSKACSELVTAAYRNSYLNSKNYANNGIALASARAGNVIGGGDWATDRLIPDCIRAILKKEKILIRNPDAIRPWQHVLEPLSGYLFLAQKLYEGGQPYAEAWNFGPQENDAKPVEWLVKKLCSQWGEGATYEVDKGEQPHEANYLKLDCSKAHLKLGWHPQWHLEKAISSITEWTLGYHNGENMRDICLDQIDTYQNSMGKKCGQ